MMYILRNLIQYMLRNVKFDKCSTMLKCKGCLTPQKRCITDFKNDAYLFSCFA